MGHGKIRVMELKSGKPLPHLVGFGETTFDPATVKDGVIENPEAIAEVSYTKVTTDKMFREPVFLRMRPDLYSV